MLGCRPNGNVDLAVSGAAGELTEFRDELTEFRDELTEFRDELTEFRRELTEFRGEIRGGFAEMRSEFTAIRGEFHLALAKHFRQTIFVFMGFTLAMWGPVVLMLAN